MARSTFSADIAAHVRRSTALLEAVVKESAQDLSNEARRPKPQGGRMPVDTAFLRNSATAEIGSVPRGEGTGGGDAQITLTIARMRLGQTLYIGFLANYAIYMEAENGFVRMAAEDWQRIVDNNVRRLAR